MHLSAVPIRLIASFKRMKNLTKDIKVIVSALETSPELVVSGHRVRRKLPLPAVDEAELLMRTVIVENLPDQATIGTWRLMLNSIPWLLVIQKCLAFKFKRSTAVSCSALIASVA